MFSIISNLNLTPTRVLTLKLTLNHLILIPTQILFLTIKKAIKNARTNIPHSHFILFNLIFLGEIVAPSHLIAAEKNCIAKL